DITAPSHPQLPFAAEYARALGAELHVLSEVPELTVSVVVDKSVPLRTDSMAERLREEIARYSRRPHVWVAESHLAEDRRKIIERCSADVLFVPQGHAPLLQWFGTRPRWFAETQCPVVMVPNEPPMRRWSLLDHESHEASQLRRAAG
ncbi:MAG: hypothetical protein JNK82_14565, partial [Myxococcaceae bacterium]|nr:hypothetical protein [Myxococcaceae bacterium]